jgi:hypothetical protein
MIYSLPEAFFQFFAEDAEILWIGTSHIVDQGRVCLLPF